MTIETVQVADRRIGKSEMLVEFMIGFLDMFYVHDGKGGWSTRETWIARESHRDSFMLNYKRIYERKDYNANKKSGTGLILPGLPNG